MDEKVPTGREAKRVVHPLARQADEASGDGHVRGHLGRRVVDHGDEEVLDDEGEQQVSGAGIVQCSPYADEDARADGGADADELELAVSQPALQVIGPIDHLDRLTGDGPFVVDVLHLGHLDGLARARGTCCGTWPLMIRHGRGGKKSKRKKYGQV